MRNEHCQARLYCNNPVMQSDVSSTDLLGPRLLLCDDSPVERLALAHYLRGAGYNVDEAGDGASALQHLFFF